jgi:hypothetical protein
MPVVEQVTLTHEQFVSVSCRMADLLNRGDQGVLEWALFRAVSDELGVDLFKLRPNECSCGDVKDSEATCCDACNSYWAENCQ